MRARTPLLYIAIMSAAAATGGVRADESPLLEVLKSRSTSIETFRCAVRCVNTSGKDRIKLAEAYKARNAWAAQHMRQLYDADKAEWADMMGRGHQPLKQRVKYFWKAPHSIRIERFGEMRADGSDSFPEAIVSVFTGERWERLNPKATSKLSRNQILVSTQDQDDYFFLDVGRGSAVFRGNYLQTQPIDSAYRMLDQVHWRDALPLLVAGGASESQESLPSGGPRKTVLNLQLAKSKKSQKPLVRVKIWFEPSDGHLPVRMEQREFTHSDASGDRYDSLKVVEWSNPIVLSNGMRLASECIIRTYDDFKTPVQNEPMENWPITSYEIEAYHLTFSNVSVNEKLDESLFSIKPPPSTVVNDRVRGQQILVGSAGEELRKTALAAREEFPLPPGPSWWRRVGWKIAFAATVIFSIAASIIWMLRNTTKGRPIQ